MSHPIAVNQPGRKISGPVWKTELCSLFLLIPECDGKKQVSNTLCCVGRQTGSAYPLQHEVGFQRSCLSSISNVSSSQLIWPVSCWSSTYTEFIMIKAPLAASLQSTLPQAVLKNPSDIFNYSAKIIRHRMVRRCFPPAARSADRIGASASLARWVCVILLSSIVHLASKIINPPVWENKFRS